MMIIRLAVAAAGLAMLAAAASPAMALSTSECSAKYQAAKTAGTLNGASWNDFRKAQCASTAAATTTPTPAAAVAPKSAARNTTKAPTAAAPTNEPNVANTENAVEPPATNAVAPKGVVFPRAVAAKYASETAGKARMHTCLDQYRQDKASNGLAGLTWVQAGGGYYSICNARLKG
jgi:hypothetical protein